MRICDLVMTFCLCGSIFFLPISGSFVEGFFVIMLLAHFVKRFIIFGKNLKQYPQQNKASLFLQSFKPQPSPLSKVLGVYVLVAFLSMVFSVDFALSFKGFMFKLLQGVYTYFIFIEAITTLRRLYILMLTFLVSVTLIVVNGFVQYFRGYDFIHGYSWWDGRLVSSFKHSNDFGAYLIVVVMILLSATAYLFVFAKKDVSAGRKGILYKILPYFLLVVFLGAVACLGLTFSRGAWLGFFIAGFCWGFQKPKRLILIPILLIVGFLFFFYPIMQKSRNVSFTTDRIDKSVPVVPQSALIKYEPPKKAKKAAAQKSVESEQNAASGLSLREVMPKAVQKMGSGRMEFWQEAINIIRDYPVLGTGLNTYSIVAPHYKINWGGYPHNCYLQMAAEMGLTGLAVFLSMIGFFIRTALRYFKHRSKTLLSFTAMGIFCGMIGFLVHAAFDTTFYSVQLDSYLWLMLGFFMSILLLENRERPVN